MKNHKLFAKAKHRPATSPSQCTNTPAPARGCQGSLIGASHMPQPSTESSMPAPNSFRCARRSKGREMDDYRLTDVTPSDLNAPRHFSGSAPSMGATKILITLTIHARATLQTRGVACSLKPASVCSQGGWDVASAGALGFVTCAIRAVQSELCWSWGNTIVRLHLYMPSCREEKASYIRCRACNAVSCKVLISVTVTTSARC